MGNRARHPSYLRRFALSFATAAVVGGASLATHAQAVRDNIKITGSSTVFPFATVVAERFGRNTGFKSPTVESTGSGSGIQQFCEGLGVQHPDIANSSRRITPSEVANCAAHGVTDIVEVKIGYDGIILANAKTAKRIDLTLREIYLALAKNVPDPAGGAKLVPNPYTKWSEINAALPATNIEVLGPPPTSGTRDAFNELAMEAGCKTFPAIVALPRPEYLAACHTAREDKRFIEAGENDNLIVQKLAANPSAIGIFGYSFLEQNEDKVQGAHVAGVTPDFDSIADGKYPISRPLYFYVKKAHIGSVPGIPEYLKEFMSDGASGEFGYLSERGLIPLHDDERRAVAAQVEKLETLKLGNAR
jgi:phosphate transport system substrate-binding protein